MLELGQRDKGFGDENRTVFLTPPTESRPHESGAITRLLVNPLPVSPLGGRSVGKA